MTWLGEVLAPILVFGLVVFVHELGHFLAAKAAGVYTPRFSIGFGPALWKRRFGETEYVLAAIPLGGYVRMASREDDALARVEGGGAEAGAGVAPDRVFEAKSLPARLMIMLAGVTMNVILGFLVLSALALYYGNPVLRTRVIGAVAVVPGAPMMATLAAGDTIVSIDGRAVHDWNTIVAAIDSGRGDTRIVTQRGAVVVPAAAASRHALAAALQPATPAVVGEVIPGSPADRAGFQRGDSLLSVADGQVASWPAAVAAIQHAPGIRLPVVVARKGRPVTVVVRPDSATQPDPVTGRPEVIGRVGIAAEQSRFVVRQPVPLGRGIATGWHATWSLAGQVVGIVRQLVTGKLSVRTLSGPVGIWRASVAAAKSGYERVFELVALLSIEVAVLNLIPIPVLDGGQIALNVAESVRGAPFGERTREYILRAGLLAIALLVGLGLYNDLANGVRDLVSAIQRGVGR